MSLLGNLYLRITSKKIEERISGYNQTSVSAIFNEVTRQGDHPARGLLKSMKTLKPSVSSNMENLLVADGLEAIISVLQEVRGFSTYPFIHLLTKV